MTVNWRWTWVNFIASLSINRLRFLYNMGLYHLHTWVTHMEPGYDNNYYIDFYISALFSTLILALCHLRPVHYGVLLPSMPAVAHVLQDGHLVPLVDNLPPQSLTRKVSFASDTFDITTCPQVSAGTEGSPLPGTDSSLCQCHLSLCLSLCLSLPIHSHTDLASGCRCSKHPHPSLHSWHPQAIFNLIVSEDLPIENNDQDTIVRKNYFASGIFFRRNLPKIEEEFS